MPGLVELLQAGTRISDLSTQEQAQVAAPAWACLLDAVPSATT